MRVTLNGEVGVEARLRGVQPFVYWTVWALVGLSAVSSLRAKSSVHPVMTVDDFISYRTFLAVSFAGRAIMWTCWIALVVGATRLQDRREAVPQPDVRQTPALRESVCTATRMCALAMLAAGDPRNEAARRVAIDAVRDRGLVVYDEEWLAHDLGVIDIAQIGRYLAPLNQSLDSPEKKMIVEQIATVGLADGSLTTAETQVLEVMGASLNISAADLRRVIGATGSQDRLRG
jgi:hypothetical protein